MAAIPVCPLGRLSPTCPLFSSAPNVPLDCARSLGTLRSLRASGSELALFSHVPCTAACSATLELLPSVVRRCHFWHKKFIAIPAFATPRSGCTRFVTVFGDLGPPTLSASVLAFWVGAAAGCFCTILGAESGRELSTSGDTPYPVGMLCGLVFRVHGSTWREIWLVFICRTSAQSASLVMFCVVNSHAGMFPGLASDLMNIQSTGLHCFLWLRSIVDSFRVPSFGALPTLPRPEVLLL